jgi:hypothetical protein
VLLAESGPTHDPLREELREIDLEQLTPIEAHRRLGELRAKAKETNATGGGRD